MTNNTLENKFKNIDLRAKMTLDLVVAISDLTILSEESIKDQPPIIAATELAIHNLKGLLKTEGIDFTEETIQEYRLKEEEKGDLYNLAGHSLSLLRVLRGDSYNELTVGKHFLPIILHLRYMDALAKYKIQ